MQRPSLEYQYAFDLCALEAYRAGGPIVIYVGDPFYARELLQRLEGCPTRLVPIGAWSSWAGDRQRWAGPQLGSPSASTRDEVAGDGSPAARTIIWAEPLPGNLAQSCGLPDALRAGGQVCVIHSGWLARLLPEWRGAQRRFPGLRSTLSWLRLQGLRVERTCGFHGPASFAWARASQVAERLGRPDRADRWGYRGRAAYVVTGWQVLLAPVAVTLARKQPSIES